MFGIGGNEIIIIVFVALLLFGPDKLPQAARTIGRFMREFKRYQAMMESTFRAEMYMAENEAKPDKSDPYKKAREYREMAGVVAPGETPAAPDESGQSDETDEDAPIAPEDAGWTPGAPDAPGVKPAAADEQEAGAQQ